MNDNGNIIYKKLQKITKSMFWGKFRASTNILEKNKDWNKIFKIYLKKPEKGKDIKSTKSNIDQGKNDNHY
jgi:hypothetical protein